MRSVLSHPPPRPRHRAATRRTTTYPIALHPGYALTGEPSSMLKINRTAHLHALTGKTVRSALDPAKQVKVYTFHLTSNDSWKASFTLEEGCAYLRYCGEHDAVDDAP